MTAPTFATASPFQRVQMLEEALEKVLDRGDGMEVGPVEGDPGTMLVWVNAAPWNSDIRTGHSLHKIARELETLLP